MAYGKVEAVCGGGVYEEIVRYGMTLETADPASAATDKFPVSPGPAVTLDTVNTESGV